VRATRDVAPGEISFLSWLTSSALLVLSFLQRAPDATITAGELLLSEECVAAMVFRDADPACCSTCVEPLETSNAMTCKSCRLERYCSAACMDSGCRAYHSSEGECAAFEAALDAEEAGRREAANSATTTTTTSECEFDFQDLPQRFLVRVLSQAGKWRVPGEPMTCRDVDAILALEAHVPPQDSPRHAWLSAISRNTLRLMDESVDEGVAFQPAAAATTLEPAAGDPGEQQPRRGEENADAAIRHYGAPQLTRLMCCVNCNAHTLYAREEWPLEPAGTAMYLQGSAFNHSCRPNAEFYNVGTSLRARSVRPVRAGEEVSVSYVPLTQSLAERRRGLSSQYNFTCTCERCQLEEQEEQEQTKGGAAKRVKLNDDARLSGDKEPTLRLVVLEHLKTLSHKLTPARAGGDTTAEDENARRAVTAVREVCDLHADALDTVKFGSEPALRLMHVVKQLDESLSTSLNRATAAVVAQMKVALLRRARGFAAVARGEDHPLCVEIDAALSAAACDR
jgi:hypothetical protein